LRRAFPEKNEAEIERIAKESYKIMIKTFMMSLWMPDTCRDDNKVAFH
jgi:KDO2-lipid IV(A) lauroyltransferase